MFGTIIIMLYLSYIKLKQKDMTVFEEKVSKQVTLNKVGIYEAFVNEGELREYWNLDGDRKSPMMKKVFVPVFNGEILSLSFERGRAIRNLLDAAGVDTLAELENI